MKTRLLFHVYFIRILYPPRTNTGPLSQAKANSPKATCTGNLISSHSFSSLESRCHDLFCLRHCLGSVKQFLSLLWSDQRGILKITYS